VKKRATPLVSSLGEFGLIARVQRRLKGKTSVVVEGIGDDCAVYRASPGRYQIITTDALVENVHFTLSTHDAETLGRKILAVNLSDLAAMGARPRVAVIVLGLPATLPVSFLDRFYRGLDGLGRGYGVTLVGGDTVRSPKGLWVSLTLVGEVKRNRFFTRAGARPGQMLLVSGTLGDSAMGLKLLSPGKKTKKWKARPREQDFLTRRHLDPTPRMELSQALAASRIRVGAMIDISDGLAQDLGHVCAASGVGAEVELERLPISQPVEKICFRNKLQTRDWALAGGEDFELLFTTPREDVKNLRRLTARVGVPVTEIGVITANPGNIRFLQRGRPLRLNRPPLGYDHFP